MFMQYCEHGYRLFAKRTRFFSLHCKDKTFSDSSHCLDSHCVHIFSARARALRECTCVSPFSHVNDKALVCTFIAVSACETTAIV